MCIVFFTVSHPGYKLILAANRDEYLDRPALPARWHDFSDHSNEGPILSGIDMGGTSVGTWCGMTRGLRVGVITNIRDTARNPQPSTPASDKPSRGRLLRSYLSSQTPISSFIEQNRQDAPKYDGFNLLLFDLKGEPSMGYLSNRPDVTESHSLNGDYEHGPHGISNTPIAQPWPKVIQGEQKLKAILSQWTDESRGIDSLLDLLSESIPLKSLSDAQNCTCIPPVLIPPSPTAPDGEGRWYGTRVSTVILVPKSGEGTFVERDVSLLENGRVSAGKDARRFRFPSC